MNRRISGVSQAFVLVATVVACAALPACFESAGQDTVSPDAIPSTTPTPSPTPTVVSSARAAKFILKQANPQGSFDTPPTNGTTAPSGFTATRVFNADGSLLAKSTTDPNWPAWIKSFEIGISGSGNASATSPDCARFTTTTETGTCKGTGKTCVGPANYYRVSERDCLDTDDSYTVAQGNGGPSDGVFLRATFSRDPSVLGTNENIMVVLEYTASGIGGVVTQPANCFNSDGSYRMDQATCGSMFWQIFMKHSLGEIVQPYLLLVPPTTQQVPAGGNPADLGTSTKQFFLPFAGDLNLSVLQISRVSAPIDWNTLKADCDPDTPFCEGMVIYSVTFYRI